MRDEGLHSSNFEENYHLEHFIIIPSAIQIIIHIHEMYELIAMYIALKTITFSYYRYSGSINIERPFPELKCEDMFMEIVYPRLVSNTHTFIVTLEVRNRPKFNVKILNADFKDMALL